MTQNYLDALSELEDNPELTVDESWYASIPHIKWDDRELRTRLKQKKKRNLRMATSEKLHIDHLLPRIVMLTILS